MDTNSNLEAQDFAMQRKIPSNYNLKLFKMSIKVLVTHLKCSLIAHRYVPRTSPDKILLVENYAEKSGTDTIRHN